MDEENCPLGCLDGGIELGTRIENDCMVQVLSTHCPWADVEPVAQDIAQLYGLFEKGFLLSDILEQPAWYIEAMMQMDNKVGKIRQAKDKTAMDKMRS